MLFDYAPDYKYYSADVTRMFPASGTFSPRAARALHGLSAALPGADDVDPAERRAARHHPRRRREDGRRSCPDSRSRSDKHRRAAQAFVDGFRKNTGNTLGHTVGMEVHDVYPPTDVLKPGMVFTIEPALTIDEDRTYVRLEDMILITETGYENLSALRARGARRHREADGGSRPIRGAQKSVTPLLLAATASSRICASGCRSMTLRSTRLGALGWQLLQGVDRFAPYTVIGVLAYIVFATVAAPSSPACGFLMTLIGMCWSRSFIGPFWMKDARNAGRSSSRNILRRDPAANVARRAWRRSAPRGCLLRRHTR